MSSTSPHVEANANKLKSDANPQSISPNPPVDDNKSTNINSKSDKDKQTTNPQIQFAMPTSEPRMGRSKAWPAVATVLGQATRKSTNSHPLLSNNACKLKSRYIDILLPR